MKEFTQINWHTIQADESAELLESGPVPSAPLVLAPIQNIIRRSTAGSTQPLPRVSHFLQ
jgi:hypothetical protein